MQSGSSSQSGRNWGATAEADASGEELLKRMQSGITQAAAEADANRGAAALYTELYGAGLLT